MKKSVIFLFLSCLISSNVWAWSFNQNVIFEEKTHEAIKEFNTSLERSSIYLADALDNLREKGFAALPYDVNPDVWKNIRQIVCFIAFMSFGWILALYGLLTVRKQLLYAYTKQSLIHVSLVSTLGFLLLVSGIVLMCFANILSYCIIG